MEVGESVRVREEGETEAADWPRLYKLTCSSCRGLKLHRSPAA